jgi:hypothetical protein
MIGRPPPKKIECCISLGCYCGHTRTLLPNNGTGRRQEIDEYSMRWDSKAQKVIVFKRVDTQVATLNRFFDLNPSTANANQIMLDLLWTSQHGVDFIVAVRFL